MKTTLLLAALTGTAAQAQSPAPVSTSRTTWFTVVGDPEDPNVDTVQVDPVDHDGNPRTMRVRVSRSTARSSWDGVPYRSYTSNVAFECDRNQARYLSLSYHGQPLWPGEPDKTVDYSTGTPRMMAFRDMTPNPTQRIIQAACRLVAKR
ncbi:hypothetical protein RD110_00135 [Rhodoferax koreense]|uniref:Surface-adhesin protein E-like domain-containing protein n=1 Tax=Rhodoferax koreensis TaxID=1842727 RepID=A0A1P8K2Z0_9BURK|nr:hypothetical protein RD110_00135 [Rhodoferax koreense]